MTDLHAFDAQLGADAEPVAAGTNWQKLPCGLQAELIQVSGVKMEAVKWIWPGYIPLGKLANCSGDPGVSKSTLSIDIAARVTRGDAMPDGSRGVLYDQPSTVVIIAGEDGIADTIHPRIAAAEGDPARVYVLRLMKDKNGHEHLVNLADIAVIRDVVLSVGAKLFIGDPIMSLLPPRVKANDDQQVRSVLMPMVDLAARMDFGGLFVSHFNKATDIANALYRNAASMGLMATYRAAFMVAEDPDNPQQSILAHVKGNLSEKPPKSLVYTRRNASVANGIIALQIQWAGESDHTHKTLLAGAAAKLHQQRLGGKGGEMSKLEEAKNFLRVGLRDGPVPSKELEKWREAAGISQRTLNRAKDQLGLVVVEKVGGLGHEGAWQWRMKDVGEIDLCLDS